MRLGRSVFFRAVFYEPYENQGIGLMKANPGAYPGVAGAGYLLKAFGEIAVLADREVIAKEGN